MIVYPNAKINIGLQVVGKRPDGYHLLESCFYPIPLKDCLEILPNEELQDDKLLVYGADNLGNLQDNLVLRAVRLLRENYDFPYLEIYLYKHIPSGAGMGGGSADASFTLKAVNDLFALGLTDKELKAYALKLGADCPFFINNRPSLGEGIGEILSPINGLSLEQYNLVIVKPDVHISTADAFRGLKNIGLKEHSVFEIIKGEPKTWKSSLFNDFEESIFPLYPSLGTIKDKLYEIGAIYASMTGSGSAIFALFEGELGCEDIEIFKDSFFWQSFGREKLI